MNHYVSRSLLLTLRVAWYKRRVLACLVDVEDAVQV